MTTNDRGEATIRGLPFRLEHSPFYLMGSAISKATRNIDAALGATRFSQTQWRVLITLWERGALSIGELAPATFVESSAIGRAVARMERDGLVTRESDPGDRRVTQVSLSPEGRLRMEELKSVVVSEINRLLDGFAEEDVRTLNAYLLRISQTADETAHRRASGSDGLESLDPAARIVGPSSDFSRIPYHLYTDPAVFELEQERIFRGPTWSYLGFKNEVREPGDYITGYVGTTPYVLTRDKDGALHAFVNRCAHRGVAVVRNLRGNARNFTCIYHQWCYALNGDLIGVPLMKGMGGVGGYPDDFSVDGHGLRKLKIETISGIVFGTFSDAAPPLEDYLGPSICARLRMVCGRPIKVTGYHRHTMRANWKLFVENTRDMYHAPMLHPFLPVFGIVDTNMKATMEMNERGGLNSLLSGYRPPPGEAEPARPRPSKGLVLEEPSVAVGVPEFPDGLAISIISIFPSCLFTLPGNTFSVRQIRPKSVDEVETLYTWYAFEDDDEEMLQRRRMQNNLFGPAGYVAMEDAEAMELIQQRISDGALEGRALLEFGGRGTEDRIDHMLSEGAIRAFWKGYCDIMDIPVSDGSAAA